MAVTSTSLASDLILVMDNGISSTGQALSQSRTYKNVKASADDADVYAVAEILIGLQSKTNNSIQRKNTGELTSE
jgi:uncharacterized protein YaaR (DUF327 family)